MSKRLRWLITLGVFPGLPLFIYLALTQMGQRQMSQWRWQILCAISPKVTKVVVEADGPIRLEGLKPYISVEVGDPLFFLPTHQTMERLLSHSEIRAVSLNRDLDATVRLNLTLRKGVAIVAGRQIRLVDNDGAIFTPSVIPESLDLPVITGIPDDWQARTPERLRILRAALELLREVLPTLADQGQQIAEIHIDSEFGYSLFTDRIGGKVVFGYPPFAPKLQRFSALLRELNPRLMEIEWVNLDFPRKAFVRFKRNGKQIFAYNAPTQREVKAHG